MRGEYYDQGQESACVGGSIECRKAFHGARLMERILPDIAEVLNAGDDLGETAEEMEGRAVSLADTWSQWRPPERLGAVTYPGELPTSSPTYSWGLSYQRSGDHARHGDLRLHAGRARDIKPKPNPLAEPMPLATVS